MKKKLVYGVGINDADYKTSYMIDGKRIRCPYYMKWIGILERCYSQQFQKRNPSYIGCSVAPEWHSLTAFKGWMEQQDWEGLQINKDLLVPGNKVYGPDRCIFVSSRINNIFLDRGAKRGLYPIGVAHDKRYKKFKSRCRDGNGKLKHLGTFDTPDQAHNAWLIYKINLVKEVASTVDSEQLREILLLAAEKLRKQE